MSPSGWGGLPEGGPALGLRSELLAAGPETPPWEGRDAGLAVDHELGRRGVLQRGTRGAPKADRKGSLTQVRAVSSLTADVIFSASFIKM